jgi:ATP-binding cassette subfamily F protein 3
VSRKKPVGTLRRAAQEAEKAMHRLAAERQTVERELARADLPGAERGPLMRRHAELAAKLAVAEAAWLAAEEALQ